MTELSATLTHSNEQGVLPHAWGAAGPVVLAGEELASWLPAMQPAYQEYARAHGMVSLVVVPLRVRGTTVALLGACLGLYFIGYSINVLTLFGMVLAIGILVDDAIVVIENVERIMAEVDAVQPEAVCGLAALLLAPENLSAAGIGPSEERFLEAVARINPALVERAAA